MIIIQLTVERRMVGKGFWRIFKIQNWTYGLISDFDIMEVWRLVEGYFWSRTSVFSLCYMVGRYIFVLESDFKS